MKLNVFVCDLCNKVIEDPAYETDTLKGSPIDLCDDCIQLIRSRQLVNNAMVSNGSISVTPVSVEPNEIKVSVVTHDEDPEDDEEIQPAKIIKRSEILVHLVPVEEEHTAEVCDGCEEEPEEKTGSEEDTDKSWDEIHAETVKAENKKPGRVRAKIPMPEDTCGINDIRLSDLQKIVNLYNHDWSVSKIAHVMGTSESVIKNRLNRVREALRNSDEN